MDMSNEQQAAPLYDMVCKDLKWSVDSGLMTAMKNSNKESMVKLDTAITDAEENFGESELRDALLKKSEFLAEIGDKDAAVEAVRKTAEKTVGLGNRMDLVSTTSGLASSSLTITSSRPKLPRPTRCWSKEETGTGGAS